MNYQRVMKLAMREVIDMIKVLCILQHGGFELKNVAELGAGDARNSLAIAAAIKDIAVTAIENDEDGVKFIRSFIQFVKERDPELLQSEVEVEQENYDTFVKLMLNLPFGQIGKVTAEKKLLIKAENGEAVIESDLDSLKDAWQKTLKW